MKLVKSVIETHYAKDGHLSDIEFLRDAINFLNARNEGLNEGKDVTTLLNDYADSVNFNGEKIKFC